MGGIRADYHGARFWDGSFTHYSTIPGQASISYEDALTKAAVYNNSIIADSYDATLTNLMQQEFGLEAGDLANPISTRAGKNIGVDEYLNFVMKDKGGRVRLANGYVKGIYGKPGPYEMGISASSLSDITTFRAVAGHEIIHAIHFSTSTSLGRMNFLKNTEAAAYNYSYNVFLNAGKYSAANSILMNHNIIYPESFRTLLHLFY